MPQKVKALLVANLDLVRSCLCESRSLGVECNKGGNLHPKLKIDGRSIANKYPEGKLKSTSKGELKDLKSFRGKHLAVTLTLRCSCSKSEALHNVKNCAAWIIRPCHSAV